MLSASSRFKGFFIKCLVKDPAEAHHIQAGSLDQGGEKTRKRDAVWQSIYRDVGRRHGVECGTEDEALRERMLAITEREFLAVLGEEPQKRKR